MAGSFDDDADPFRSMHVLFQKLCGTNEIEYPKCRMIASTISKAGLSGFRFNSYFSAVGRESFFNVALFGYPINDGRVIVESVNRVILLYVDYDFRFGPVLIPDRNG